MPRSDTGHWSNYWAGGHLTSLPQDFRANYDGEIAAFWAEQFRQVPDGGAMLDVCTGNGAVALLASAFADSEGRSLEVHAVDAAAIDPQAMATRFPAQARLLGAIRFAGEQRVEELPYPDRTFDLVTSHYGIEYCDWEPAARQVQRVLKPGGRFVMVNHAATSAILRTMEKEDAEYRVLESVGFFVTIGGFLGRRIDFPAFRRKMSEARQVLEPKYRSSGSALYRSILGVLNEILPMERKQLTANLNNLERFYRDLRSARARLDDMLRVNRAIESDPEWQAVFADAGLEHLASGEIHYQGRHHAGRYHAYRRPTE